MGTVSHTWAHGHKQQDFYHTEHKEQKRLADTNLQGAQLLQDHGVNGKTQSINSNLSNVSIKGN